MHSKSKFSVNTGDSIRIISWNCNNGTIEQNIEFLSDFHADVVVLQEVKKPKESIQNHFWFGDNPRKGHAIIASQDYSVEMYADRGENPDAIPIIIHGPTIFNLLMVWTHAKMLYVEGMQQIIDEYSSFLKTRPSVIIGDFNSSTNFDHLHKNFNHSTMVDLLLNEYGLVSAYHKKFSCNQGEESHPTHYYRWKKEKPFHIDYCFIPDTWIIENMTIGNYEDWRELSDHRPLIVDISIN